MIIKLEQDAAVISGSGQPPDSLSDFLGRDRYCGRKWNRSLCVGRRRPIAAVTVEHGAVRSKVELRIFINLRYKVRGHLESIDRFIVRKSRFDGRIAQIGVI